jgi:hypothetical protein
MLPCFSTTVEFPPILYEPKQDAQDKGQIQRAHIFNQLIQRVEARQGAYSAIPSQIQQLDFPFPLAYNDI